MKLIVDIPEVMYDWLVNGFPDEDDFKKCYELVIKGTSLPKGHGDLIDRRELIKNGVSRGFCDWYDEIKYAETIIEADDKNKAKSATSYDSNEEDREI